MRGRPGFTLIELLVVVAILAILAAILFPVFASARRYSKSAGCLSNLRQLGQAVQMYHRDWNDRFPHALDAADYYTNIWDTFEYAGMSNAEEQRIVAEAKALKARPNRKGMLDQVMLPYTRTTLVWRCPADIGIRFLNLSFSAEDKDSAGKTCYEAFHLSYGYMTWMAFFHINVGMLKNPGTSLVFCDNAGYWHARYSRPPRSTTSGDVNDHQFWNYNALFADGHCRNITDDDLYAYWRRYHLQELF